MSVIDDTTLVIHRTFDALPEQVFDAWLTREQWEAWIGPEGIACAVPLLEPRVGGRYRIDMTLSDGSKIPVAGVFRVIARPQTLSFTWGWDGEPSRESLITLTFEPRDGGTAFTLRQDGLGDVGNRDRHANGWNGTLNKLQRFLAHPLD